MTFIALFIACEDTTSSGDPQVSDSLLNDGQITMDQTLDSGQRDVALHHGLTAILMSADISVGDGG